MGMNMNMIKTEYIRIGKDYKDPTLEITKTKSCYEYKYWSSISLVKVWTTSNTEYNVEKRAQFCIQYFLLTELHWKEQWLPKVIVEPILVYGAECWQMREKGKKKIYIL